MQNNKKVFEKIVSKTKIYLIIIFIILVVFCVKNHEMILPAILIYLVVMAYTFWTNSKGKNQITETLQDLTLTIDSAAKSSLINSPIPLIILNSDGKIIWKSSRFASEFANIETSNLLADMLEEVKKKKEKKEKDFTTIVEVGSKSYRVIGKYSKQQIKDKRNKTEYMFILYFIDETENIRLQQEYKKSKTCVLMINLDNYDENMQQLDTEKRSQIIAQIDKLIYEWTDSAKGVLIKSDRDKYLYFFEQRYLEVIKEDKFSILDKIKEIETNDKVQLTLSIAVSTEGTTDKERYNSVQSAMDMILGRGGDQAVVKENEIYKFYGGRAIEIEKRTKVKARVVAHKLETLIKDSSNVIIMGHKNPDMDSIGSSMGMYRLAKELGKRAYIVAAASDVSIKPFTQQLLEDEEYEDILISGDVAEENIDKDSALIIVYTPRENFVEYPILLNKTKKIAIIDHHRRSTDYIENAEIIFQEVYASSAAELVTEIIQQAETDVRLKTLEIESLYAGIMMDTKNFTFKTGVRTFEAAAFLRKCGVDIIRVKKWFQSDLESFNKIAEIVKTAEIINNSIAIAMYNKNEMDVNLMCAKAADELLTISNITASFVLGKIGDKVCISARSIGDINVQVILEKLGGGGHITLAGAQILDKTIIETKEILIEKINEYFTEIEN